MNIALTLGLTLAITPAFELGGDQALGKVVQTTLTKIRKSPNAYKNVWVSFPIQFVSLGKVENPFFTQFVPQSFANFYCWADEQQIWNRKQYEDVFGLLFMAKENEKLSEIYKMKVYQRIRVTGIVRNTFQGEPWIEITDFKVLDKAVDTASLSHMYRGHSFMQKRKWARALSELSLAPGNHLPDHVMGQIHKDLALCHLRLGESDTAARHLEQAVSKLKTLDPETRRMARMAKIKPQTFMDPDARAKLEDHERPMWEAFVDEKASAKVADRPSSPPATSSQLR
ncbi:MAG: hypothetical protein VX951_06560 [Planctomycetota bacterium]|nr:hypothetical protein [Planctomycetota bacterium]